jgi:hypothetical protein
MLKSTYKGRFFTQKKTYKELLYRKSQQWAHSNLPHEEGRIFFQKKSKILIFSPNYKSPNLNIFILWRGSDNDWIRWWGGVATGADLFIVHLAPITLDAMRIIIRGGIFFQKISFRAGRAQWPWPGRALGWWPTHYNLAHYPVRIPWLGYCASTIS